MRTGIANLPLHHGKAPLWLFERMTHLAREISCFVVSEFNSKYLLEKLADPYWLQSLGCVLGFDWHSSGLTTTTCGALKEGIRGLEKDLDFYAAGGKGKTSRKTPEQITAFSEKMEKDPAKLIYASRMSAKVDNNALQDGYQLYHHCFFFNSSGHWSVIQQGMNENNRYARRYHWLSSNVDDFTQEPQNAIWAMKKTTPLNLVAKESKENRKTATLLSREKPTYISSQLRLMKELNLPRKHEVLVADINPERLESIFIKTYEKKAKDFEQLLAMAGVGPKTIRALSLIAELVYGAEASHEDPARYSFTHGGKDGFPYPVNRAVYDTSIEVLNKALSSAKIGSHDKVKAFRRLAKVR